MKTSSKFRLWGDAYVNGNHSCMATHIVNIYAHSERLPLNQGIKAIEKGIRAYIAKETGTSIVVHVYIGSKCAGIITAQKNGRRVDFVRDLYNLDWAIAE